MKKENNIKEAKVIEQSDNEKEKANINKKNYKYMISNKLKNIIITILLTFTCCLLIFGIFYEVYLKDLIVEKTKIQKDVTVTDSGIADAVDKVYDSVVVIENYINDRVGSSGTGFVFKTDDKYGYILTNYHVVDNSKKIVVTFTNNKKIEASSVGIDEYSDIAVLKVDKSDVISVAKIGSVDSLRVGDTTFTVGAPLDSSVYSWTVTRGILSGKNRLVEVTINNTNSVMEVLQTDAAINSGNSGGPLCNSNGEVVGITNMKIASSSIEGMGFAIPVDTAIKTANDFIEGKTVSRPYLGVSVYETNSSVVYVEYVQRGSAADKAGIEKGDKILKIDNESISSAAQFRYQLYKYNVGDKITLTIERNEKEKKLNVTLSSANGGN